MTKSAGKLSYAILFPTRMGMIPGKKSALAGLWIFSFSFFLFPFSLPAQTTPQELIRSLAQKLERWDVEETWVEVSALLAREPKNPQLLELAAQAAFHRGEYPEALKLMRSAIEFGEEDEHKKGFALFIESTIGVLSPFKKIESPHFLIFLDEKQDGVLADYLIDTLEKTHKAIARQYAFEPKEKIRLHAFGAGH
jgi:hypothetical protein